MLFGVQVRPTTSALDVRELGRVVEGLGFESLFFPEHTHMPVRLDGDAPGDDAWLRTNSALFDPFLALAAVGAVTSALRLGTGVCLLPQRDPIVLAKEVATLDVLSGGRVLLGIGAGWNRAEMRHHGIDPDARFAIMREHVQAMRAIWTQEQAEFRGAFVDFAPSYSWPKPVQQPHPPVLVGGEGPRVLERVLDYGDGWLPNDHPQVLDRIVELDRQCAQQGRARIPVTVYSVDPDPARVEQLRTAGAARCVFTVPNARTGPAEVRAALEELARLTGRS